MVAQSSAYVVVAGVYNAKAIDSARRLSGMKPGVAEAASAPGLLNTAKVVTTALPAQIDKGAEYGSMLGDYMTSNKLTPPSKDDQRKIAMSNGADAATVANSLP
jgi:hypothetical protein